MDKIIIKGLKVFAYHGVNLEEKRDGQNFLLDVILYTSLERAGQTDNVVDTISYSEASKIIVKTMQNKPYDLLETIANKIVNELFFKFDKLEGVKIKLVKPEAPMNLMFETMGIEIHRKRSEYIGRSSS